MLISFVIPSFNSSATIKRTLNSLFSPTLPTSWSLEAIVVDDGSSDTKALKTVVDSYLNARMLSHSKNQGMCAARNTGIASSLGEIVIILDSDDELVTDWPKIFESIIREWPKNSFVCYAAARNPEGVVTAENPNFSGYVTLYDFINERYSGEYMPIFRGDYIREKQYVNIGTRKSCGVISYIRFLHDAPLWISNRILRIYYDNRPGSISSDFTNSKKACESVKCYSELFQRYGHLYQQNAPKIWYTKQLRLSVYLYFSKMPGTWVWWCRGASLTCLKETLGALIIILIERRMAQWLIKIAKQFRVIRRNG